MPTTNAYSLSSLGDSAVLIQVGDRIDMDTHARVQAIASFLEQNAFPGLVELVPAFTTVTVYYDPIGLGLPLRQTRLAAATPYQHICSLLEGLLAQVTEATRHNPRLVEIPVCYGGEWGPDLEVVAAHNGLSPEEVIAIHSGVDYVVYMVGFAPGFPYLGGLPEAIATPRRASPRLSIPTGTVGIAGSQTGVYPIATPGGWQLIGRTPLALFRPTDDPPSLLQAGDKVRFRPIAAEEMAAWKEGDATWA